jgi:LmbE family N-acetylglucosaminyl deacetylase
MAVPGPCEHRIADFPTEGSSTPSRASRVADLIDEINPTILTFAAGSFHPDHIAVHEWVTAWEDRGCRSRLPYAV